MQDYISRFDVRKFEASALVVMPEVGGQLCREGYLQYVPADAPVRYQRRLQREQAKLEKAIRQTMGRQVTAPATQCSVPSCLHRTVGPHQWRALRLDYRNETTSVPLTSLTDSEIEDELPGLSRGAIQ